MAILNRDTWIGLVMMAVAGLFWWEADKIRVSPLDDPVGASGLPKALAYALAALALFLIARSVVGAILAVRTKAADEETPGWRERVKPHLRAIGMLGLGVGYLLIVSTLGYTISVALLIFAVSLYIGAPMGLRTVLVAVLGGIGFYFLFVQFLGIPLPDGELIPALFRAGDAAAASF